MLDSHFCIPNWTFALLKRVDHAHFLKAENYLFCMKQIILLWQKKQIKVTPMEGRRGDPKVTKVHKQEEQVATRER